MKTSFIKNNTHLFFVFIGLGLFSGLWGVMSLYYHSVLVPSPLETYYALADLTASGELAENLLISLNRLGIGLFCAVLWGTVMGVLAGFLPAIEWLLIPVVSILLSTPAIVFVVMAMVWFGMTSKMVIFIIILLVSPIMYVNTMDGIRSIDSKLREMATVFQVPLSVRLSKIYLPGFIHSFFTRLFY